MIAIQRRNKIKEILIQDRSVKVSDLARRFNVSEETIRRDLSQLEDEGVAKKNYGGAILVEELEAAMKSIPPVSQRKLQYFEEKDAIGRAAAAFVDDGQIAIFDAGSTTWCISRHLQDVQDLTVVTNAIDVVESLSHQEGSTIFLLGGKLVKKSMSLVGPQAEQELRKYNADVAFLGTSGISLTSGFTSSDIYEAEIKRAMVAAGKKVVVVADHSKFDRKGLVSFASLQDVDVLVTSELVDPAVKEQIALQGVEVITCPVTPSEAAGA